MQTPRMGWLFFNRSEGDMTIYRRSTSTVAFLCSGGDAPGMNACLRAFVRLGLNRYGRVPLAVKDGYSGLVRTCHRVFDGQASPADLRAEVEQYRGNEGLRRQVQDLVWMDHRSVSGIVARGGTILGCSRCDDFRNPDIRRRVIDLLANLDVEALVVCGGNGTFAGAACLADEGDRQVIGIPATIDNDVEGTDKALGVDTALNNIVSSVRKFNDTADSHHRVMVLEIMGRNSGYLAQMAALASGAEIVVTPERPDLDDTKLAGIAQRIEELMLAGRRHAIVLVAEGVHVDPVRGVHPTNTLARYLVSFLEQRRHRLGEIEVRSSILGHLQRGGPPSAYDCILGARFAEAAWDVISGDNLRSGSLGLVGNRIQLAPFGSPNNDCRDVSSDYQLQKDVSDRRNVACARNATSSSS